MFVQQPEHRVQKRSLYCSGSAAVFSFLSASPTQIFASRLEQLHWALQSGTNESTQHMHAYHTIGNTIRRPFVLDSLLLASCLEYLTVMSSLWSKILEKVSDGVRNGINE